MNFRFPFKDPKKICNYRPNYLFPALHPLQCPDIMGSFKFIYIPCIYIAGVDESHLITIWIHNETHLRIRASLSFSLSLTLSLCKKRFVKCMDFRIACFMLSAINDTCAKRMCNIFFCPYPTNPTDWYFLLFQYTQAMTYVCLT